MPKYFECMCHSPEHVLRVEIDEDFKCVVFTTYLDHYLPWYKRIIVAIRYVLGFEPSQYGHFSETLLKDEDTKKLIELLESVLNSKEAE